VKEYPMKKVFGFIVISMSILLVACNNSSDPTVKPSAKENPELKALKEDIEKMETQVKQGGDSVNRTLANQLLRSYQDYYNKAEKDSIAYEYLFKASTLADGIGKYPKAVELLVNFHDGVKSVDRRAEAAYLIAFIYDAHIKDTEKAALYYNKVIETYPTSKWAQQAADALKIVNMSDADLIKFLQEKNNPR
jgi:tetratricopeptide (TPR) repeat protein